MNETYKVRRVGGTLMVTVPQHVARVLLIEAGQEVAITVAASGKRGVSGLMIVEPQGKPSGKGKRKRG